MNDPFGFRFPTLIGPSTTPPADASHLRERECEIKQVPGGYIIRLSGGGTKWHQRVATDEDVLIGIVRGFLNGTLKETP